MNNIKSLYIIKRIFNYMDENKQKQLIIYNKRICNRLSFCCKCKQYHKLTRYLKYKKISNIYFYNKKAKKYINDSNIKDPNIDILALMNFEDLLKEKVLLKSGIKYKIGNKQLFFAISDYGSLCVYNDVIKITDKFDDSKFGYLCFHPIKILEYIAVNYESIRKYLNNNCKIMCTRFEKHNITEFDYKLVEIENVKFKYIELSNNSNDMCCYYNENWKTVIFINYFNKKQLTSSLNLLNINLARFYGAYFDKLLFDLTDLERLLINLNNKYEYKF